MIDITGLDKAAVLAALYNAAKPQGLGFLHYDPKPMTVEEAAELLKEFTHFDYLKGRVMKVNLSEDLFDPYLYDRDNGNGAAHTAVDSVRAGGVYNAHIALIHERGTRAAAQVVQDSLDKETKIETGDGVTVILLGLSDMKEWLEPTIKEILSDG